MFREHFINKYFNRKPLANTHGGFTLIELIITVTVLAIVIAIALPSFRAQVINWKSVTLGETFVAEVNAARFQAVSRATRISICASSDDATCTGSWTDGAITFVDTAASDSAAAPIVGAILRVWPDFTENSDIAITNTGGAVTFFRFTALGRLAVINGPVAINAKVTNCSSARSVTIGLTGMVSVVKSGC